MQINDSSGLAGRATSGFPLSIGTSLALESLFNPRSTPYDPNREIPNVININNYNEIYFNISTLFRNLTGSVDKKVFLNISVIELAEVLEFELELINDIFRNEGNNVCKPIYYNIDYDSIAEKLLIKKVVTRIDNTEYQKYYNDIFNKTLKLIKRNNKNILEIEDLIKPSNRNSSLIVSHYAYDLLSEKNFKQLDLLESHTGKLKHLVEFNSKYYPITEKNLSHLPFNKKLLYIFGDKTFIKPSDIRLRLQILETSIKRKWTPATTKEKILFDLDLDIKEPYVLAWIKSL